ncbi:ATP-binding cassette domain-containing protein [Anaerosolibacter carboniphilus]|nr:ATP-binding cassette domain-containing protein [Anaerosolibacter carboniphilus]
MQNPIGCKDDIQKALLEVESLSKHYVVKKNLFSPKTVIRAVDHISFDIYEGEALGLIGESGSGKTTTGELILRLISADAGRVLFQGEDILQMGEDTIRKKRKDIQIIFQQAQETLDPKATIAELIAVPLRIHRIVPASEIESEVDRLLNMVGLTGKDKHKFTYQLSGGQRQRIGIARAIASRPKLVVCDEPVSALDVSVQGQILNLLIDLKKELSLTYLFISHDLKVVQHICDHIAVMYKGKILEMGEKNQIMANPTHDYTKQLITSMI